MWGFMCYYCKHDCNEDELIACDGASICWKGIFVEADGYERPQRGCAYGTKEVRELCDNRLEKNKKERHIECCTLDFCNSGRFPTLRAPNRLPNAEEIDEHNFKILYILAGFLLVACIIFIFVALKFLKRHRLATDHKYRLTHLQMKLAKGDKPVKEKPSTPHNLPSESSSSTSILIQPKLLDQITLLENIGSFGSYELWRGTQQQGTSVMVKIYTATSETLWTHEVEVYTKLPRLKHENILEYIGNDIANLENDRRLWLVTHDHPNGSLMNYLKMTKLTQSSMLQAISSLARGLAYLHILCITLTTRKKGKLSMAHRNLSSKTIFVKNDGECVIGGLEHTVTQERLDQTDFLKHASARYMSPELLEPGFVEEGIWSLDTFQKADIYSLALILWEICRMCIKKENENVVLEYMAPFSEWLADNEQEPTIEKMRELILGDNDRRPGNPNHWEDLPIMKKLWPMIQKCWDKKPKNRLPIHRVKKILQELSMD